MRIVKIVVLLLGAVGISLAAHQLLQKQSPRRLDRPATTREPRQGLRIISSIPSHRNGIYDLGDIALVDERKAWAVGYDGVHPERLYHSTDGGQTWKPVEVPGNEWITFKALSFVDLQHGWAVGGNGLVIRTANGGRSWELLKSPTTSELEAVYFVNSEVGYAGGTRGLLDRISGEVTGSLEILCTKDGGETWRRCYKENEPISVFQITSTSESTAFAITGGNCLLRTDDQGTSWRAIPLTVRYVAYIAFAPNGSGWVVGSGGTFLRSDDGGMTWQRPAFLSEDFGNQDWNAIAFNAKGCGLAVGENNTLALTTDNGKTWELQTVEGAEHLRGVWMQGSQAIVLDSQKLYGIDLPPCK